MAVAGTQLSARSRSDRVRSVIATHPFATFFVGVVVVQALHVFEHIVQLAQVYVFGVAEDRALGLLGEVAEIQGTEEWLHLGFNALYFTALAAIAAILIRERLVPFRALVPFLVFAVGLEAWHVTEHGVIIGNILVNNGCPCPGILDARLGISDTILHFFYNAIAFAATLVPLGYVLRRGRP